MSMYYIDHITFALLPTSPLQLSLSR